MLCNWCREPVITKNINTNVHLVCADRAFRAKQRARKFYRRDRVSREELMQFWDEHDRNRNQENTTTDIG